MSREKTNSQFGIFSFFTGAGFLDLGNKCFDFTKMDSREIRRIKELAIAP